MPANPSIELLRTPHEKVDTLWFHEILYYGPDAFTSLDDPVGPLEPIVDMEEYLNTLAEVPCVCICDRRPTERAYTLLYHHTENTWRAMSVVVAWDPMGTPRKPVFYQSASLEKLLTFLGLHPTASLLTATSSIKSK
jgi:hypothetical protein